MSECTKGELEAIGSSKFKFKDAYFIRLKNKEDSFIAKTYGHTGFPAEANAKEIVRRYNAFEDGGLVEELRKALEKISDIEDERYTHGGFDLEVNNISKAVLASNPITKD